MQWRGPPLYLALIARSSTENPTERSQRVNVGDSKHYHTVNRPPGTSAVHAASSPRRW